jgi:para-aminobenzoate synthetase component 1
LLQAHQLPRAASGSQWTGDAVAPAPEAAARLQAPVTGGDAGLDEVWYRAAFARVQGHLRAGDAYQINLTGFVPFRARSTPWEMFQHQARTNPVPFAAFLRLEEAVVTCHSPERLLRLRDDLAETAPIKGTAVAGGEGALLASQKDRAEHVMIVDLARNDLGGSCRFGTVQVAELMGTLPLAHLVHLVSRVHGRVRPEHRHNLLADLFPGGSITGAPKRRAMEIIASVEQSARGPYTGSIGFVDRAGNADWNIAIRTAVWQGEHAYFGCGGGVVLDSDCDRELAEAALKARSFSASLAESLPPRTTAASEGPEPQP